MMDNILNYSTTGLNAQIYTNHTIIQYTNTRHAISLWEILLAGAVFAFLAYMLIRVSNNREKYESWINPNGKVVNLYKLVRIYFWAYTGIIILLGIVQIILTIVRSK